MRKLKDLFKRIVGEPKKTPGKQRVKRRRRHQSREDFEADFKRRLGKPGRIPEDVA